MRSSAWPAPAAKATVRAPADALDEVLGALPPGERIVVVLSSLCVLLGAWPQAARADELSLELDPAQSTVTFTLRALLHTVGECERGA